MKVRARRRPTCLMSGANLWKGRAGQREDAKERPGEGPAASDKPWQANAARARFHREGTGFISLASIAKAP